MIVALSNQSGSILVVEDDVRELDALTDLLKASGYTVQKAQNGQRRTGRSEGPPAGHDSPRSVDAGDGRLGIHASAAPRTHKCRYSGGRHHCVGFGGSG